MNRSKWFLAVGALSALTLTFVLSWAWASGGDSAAAPSPGSGPGTAKMDHGHRGRHGPLGFLAHELNLSDAQRDQIQAIFKASWDESASWRTQLDGLRQQVHDSVVANGFNEPQVRALVEANSPVMVAMTVHGIATLAKVRAVLTPEQQQRLDELRANRKDHGPGPGGESGFGPGFGPGPW